MLPFDLALFDEDGTLSSDNRTSTAQKVQSLAIQYLGKSGVEREAAAVLLSKLYTRCKHSR